MTAFQKEAFYHDTKCFELYECGNWLHNNLINNSLMVNLLIKERMRLRVWNMERNMKSGW